MANRSIALTMLVALAPCAVAAASPLAITGATLIDVADRGHAAHDIANAVVVMQDGKIIAAGPAATTPIPTGAAILVRPGKFIIPGLVDGFCGLQNQAEANAELYEGVTTVVASGDDRRGARLERAHPSPPH